MSDHSKGFIDLLGQLSLFSLLSYADFLARFAELGDDYVILIIEDLRSGRIVATGTVFVEKKFLRGCGMVGRLVDHAKASGCYKVILDCTADTSDF